MGGWIERAGARQARHWHSLPRLVLTAWLAVLLVGCSVRLAPDYDPSVVTGLEEALEEVMTLFSSVSSGTSARTFSEREPAYDSAIGKIEALRVTAQARPGPPASPFGGLSGTTIQAVESPTPEVLATAVKPLVFMRDTDRSQGLTPTLVEGFKRSFETSIAQALTYEKALQR